MAIFVYPRWPLAVILDFIESEIAPFDPPFPKTLARTRRGVDRNRMHRFRDMMTYWSKIAEKPTPLSFGTFLWGDPLRIF